MARLSAWFILLGLWSTIVIADFSQNMEKVNADCDNGCFFSSLPGGACTTDAACMCEQRSGETNSCCIATNCASIVPSNSWGFQTSNCESRHMLFTFDQVAGCGISPSTAASSATVTDTVNGASTSTPKTAMGTATSASLTGSQSAASADASSIESQTRSGSTPTVTANSASMQTVGLGAVGLIAVAGMFV